MLYSATNAIEGCCTLLSEAETPYYLSRSDIRGCAWGKDTPYEVNHARIPKGKNRRAIIVLRVLLLWRSVQPSCGEIF